MKIINRTEYKYFDTLVKNVIISHSFTNGGKPFDEIEITDYIFNRIHMLIDSCEFVLELHKNELNGTKRTIDYTFYLLDNGILREFFSDASIINV